ETGSATIAEVVNANLRVDVKGALCTARRPDNRFETKGVANMVIIVVVAVKRRQERRGLIGTLEVVGCHLLTCYPWFKKGVATIIDGEESVLPAVWKIHVDIDLAV